MFLYCHSFYNSTTQKMTYLKKKNTNNIFKNIKIIQMAFLGLNYQLFRISNNFKMNKYKTLMKITKNNIYYDFCFYYFILKI